MLTSTKCVPCPNDRSSLKSLAFHFHFLSSSRFLFCGKNFAVNQSWRERLLVSSVFVMHICHTLLEYAYKKSQIEDRYCAMFVAQHYTANTKASTHASRWKFKKGLSRNQVKARARHEVEAWAQSFSTARQAYFLTGLYHWSEDTLIWCLSETFTNSWQVENFKMRAIVKTKIFKTYSSGLFRTEVEPST